MVTKINNVIPIAYFGGSGGLFLSAFCNAAYQNNNTEVMFSSRGNAHSSKFASHGGPKRVTSEQEHSVLRLIESRKYRSFEFVASHITEDSLFDYFEKNIKIALTEDDLHEVNLAFIGKYHHDDQQHSPRCFMGVYRRRLKLLQGNLCSWFLKPSLREDTLNITWPQMIREPAEILINEISQFTNIPAKNFNVGTLLQWRTKTLNGIDNTITQMHP